MNDRIVSSLVGLVGACTNNGKTENTDSVVLHSLLNCFNETDEEFIISEIIKEKYIIAPNCATCASPCGNTSDYDMQKYYTNLALKSLKEESLREASSLAEKINASGQTKLPEVIYKTISFFGYDLSEATYKELIESLKQMEV